MFRVGEVGGVRWEGSAPDLAFYHVICSEGAADVPLRRQQRVGYGGEEEETTRERRRNNRTHERTFTHLAFSGPTCA